jgi:hypothetical protein
MCFRVFGLVSRSIRETLASRALDRKRRTLLVGNADADAVRIAERKLVQIPLQMLFAAEVVDTLHAALEDAEEVLDVVRCLAVRSNVKRRAGSSRA